MSIMQRKVSSGRVSVQFVCILVCGFSFFSIPDIFADHCSIPALKEQLNSINKYWVNHDSDFSEPVDQSCVIGDVQLIQCHLRLVEAALRKNCPAGLTQIQINNREKCLDILHQYWTNGVFPINTHHPVRTPYFIDERGTACAVGQVIISTGFLSLAEKISRENNYALIEDLHYPELKSWAAQFGFVLDELKWIQPTYPQNCTYTECEDDTHRNVSCYGGNDGCIGNPQELFWASGASYIVWPIPIYYWNSGVWQSIDHMCDLSAGNYRLEAYDLLDSALYIYYTITQPEPILHELGSTYDDGTCNGTVAVSATGGVPPYTYEWTDQQQFTNTIQGLCSGVYHVVISDANGCRVQDSVIVDFISATRDVLTQELQFYPNPVSQKLSYSTEMQVLQGIKVDISDSMGHSVFTEKINQHYSEVDVSDLPDGIYFLRLSNGSKVVQKKFIKSSSF